MIVCHKNQRTVYYHNFLTFIFLDNMFTLSSLGQYSGTGTPLLLNLSIIRNENSDVLFLDFSLMHCGQFTVLFLDKNGCPHVLQFFIRAIDYHRTIIVVNDSAGCISILKRRSMASSCLAIFRASNSDMTKRAIVYLSP